MSKNKFRGFIGTYTKGDSKGIYSFVFDQESEQITDIELVAEVNNPTYVTVSEDNRYLYAVGANNDQGGLVAYAIDLETNKLQELNRQMTEGSSPCYVGVNHDNSQVLAAYYHRGSVELFETNNDGSLNPRKSVAEFTGSGPNKDRQEKPHTHYAQFTPNEKFVAVVDLGIDQIITFDVSSGELKEGHKLSVRPGSGPRHLAFHPNGKMAYCMTELSNEVIVLEFNQEDGSFKELQYIPTIPEDFTENSQGAAIRVTKDGRFVYVSNRGHNSIASFKVEADGTLTYLEYTASEGNWPRDFQFDPTEEYVVGSNQESGNLVLYKRDTETGRLTVIDKDIKVPYPVCVAFLHE
ncbi:lactonase family protein [Pallidibacillus pasinlerensis]|uniref:Lactonase family protein n=1 Tax=Pallidibacillus pasinlerensis TaxID=2703818 RepID=A0ABX0A8D4_9BACI|nr:lactonase family protein [Pallidibacillus pasinlerensis]NCU18774.1 lactonase family protein [Pallidibacillus pasinlerensis]